MPRYSLDRKAVLLKKMMSPGVSVHELARQEGVSAWSLYNWRKQAKAGGACVPEQNKQGYDVKVRFALGFQGGF